MFFDILMWVAMIHYALLAIYKTIHNLVVIMNDSNNQEHPVATAIGMIIGLAVRFTFVVSAFAWLIMRG